MRDEIILKFVFIVVFFITVMSVLSSLLIFLQDFTVFLLTSTADMSLVLIIY